MKQRYQDAMCIVEKYGKPDLFLTVTCNPKWPKIVNNLLPGQTVSDRPHLTTRVFRMYLRKENFGRSVAHIQVIEFQKRGYPFRSLNSRNVGINMLTSSFTWLMSSLCWKSGFVGGRLPSNPSNHCWLRVGTNCGQLHNTFPHVAIVHNLQFVLQLACKGKPGWKLKVEVKQSNQKVRRLETWILRSTKFQYRKWSIKPTVAYMSKRVLLGAYSGGGGGWRLID